MPRLYGLLGALTLPISSTSEAYVCRYLDFIVSIKGLPMIVKPEVFIIDTTSHSGKVLGKRFSKRGVLQDNSQLEALKIKGNPLYRSLEGQINLDNQLIVQWHDEIHAADVNWITAREYLRKI